MTKPNEIIITARVVRVTDEAGQWPKTIVALGWEREHRGTVYEDVVAFEFRPDALSPRPKPGDTVTCRGFVGSRWSECHERFFTSIRGANCRIEQADDAPEPDRDEAGGGFGDSDIPF